MWLGNLDGANKRAPSINEGFKFTHNENLQCRRKLCSPRLYRRVIFCLSRTAFPALQKAINFRIFSFSPKIL